MTKTKEKTAREKAIEAAKFCLWLAHFWTLGRPLKNQYEEHMKKAQEYVDEFKISFTELDPENEYPDLIKQLREAE